MKKLFSIIFVFAVVACACFISACSNVAEETAVYTLNEDKTGYVYAEYKGSETTVVVPETYKDLPVVSVGEKAFYLNLDITEVTVGKNVKAIGDGAFYGCSGLTKVTLSYGLVEIGVNAFSSCSGLTDFTIPASVKVIRKCAFIRCTNLKRVTFKTESSWYVALKDDLSDKRALGYSSLFDPVNSANYLTKTYVNHTWLQGVY